MRKITIVVVGLLAALAAGACGSESDPDSESPDVAGSNTEGPPPADGGSGSDEGAGTAENPLGTGVEFEVGDWIVEYGSTNTDAADEIAAEIEFSDPPASGRQYLMAEVTVAYAGDASADPFIDLTFGYQGPDGSAFGDVEDDFCGLIPNDLFEVGELGPGESATANVCVSVPAEQVDGGVWMVEDLWALDESSRTFVAVG